MALCATPSSPAATEVCVGVLDDPLQTTRDAVARAGVRPPAALPRLLLVTAADVVSLSGITAPLARGPFDRSFVDLRVEQAFQSVAARDLVYRAAAFIALDASIIAGIELSTSALSAAIAVVVMLVVAGLAVTPLALAHARKTAIALKLFIIALGVISTVLAVTMTTATFNVVMFLAASLIIISPSAPFAAAMTLFCTTAWALIAAGCFLPHPGGFSFETPVEIAVVAAIIGAGVILWASARSEQREVFRVVLALNSVASTTMRVLTATLPRSIVPAVMEHFGQHGAWPETPTVITNDVTVVILRLPPLSEAPFALDTPDAIVQLNSLWAMCTETLTQMGVTTLEVTGLKLVGVVGFGGSTDAASDAARDAVRAVRACRALAIALPRAFSVRMLMGVHTGPVCAGFLGTVRPHYSLAGCTVNVAARVASEAHEGGIAVSVATQALISPYFEVLQRAVTLKGLGDVTVFDIQSERSSDLTVNRRASDALLGNDFEPIPRELSDTTLSFIPSRSSADTAYQRSNPSLFHKHASFAFQTAILLFVLLCDAWPPPSLARMCANAALLSGAGFVWLLSATCLSERTTRLVSYAVHVVVVLGLPFFAQRLRTLAYALVIAAFAPPRAGGHVIIVAEKFISAALATVLASYGFYASDMPDSGESTWTSIESSFRVGAPLLAWVWVSWAVASLGHLQLEAAARKLWQHKHSLRKAQATGSSMLKQLLPRALANSLEAGVDVANLTSTDDDVAILIVDIADFTAWCASRSALSAFHFLDAAIRAFEVVAHAEGAAKVKTLGDSVIFAVGLRHFPSASPDVSSRVSLLSRLARGLHITAAHLDMRVHIGVHVGQVTSGVLNARGFLFDVWGDAKDVVTTAYGLAPPGCTVFTAPAAAALNADEARLMRLTSLPDVDGRGMVFYVSSRSEAIEGVMRPLSSREWSFAPPFPLADAADEFLWTWSWNAQGSCGNAAAASARLPAVALALMQPWMSGSGLSEASLIQTVRGLCDTYSLKGPYFHTLFHAVAVLHAFVMLARLPFAGCLFTDLEIIVLALAALGHDAGHRGFTSAFEVSAKSSIAAAHGGSGPVLERHHAKVATAIMCASGLFDGVGPEKCADALHAVNASIMATDMARHDAIVADLVQASHNSRGFASLSPDVRAGALMHAADLSAHAFPRAIAEQWSNLIMDEFTSQVRAEEQAGMAVTPFIAGLDSLYLRARMQAGFSSGVVMPLWGALGALANGTLSEPLQNVDANVRHYAALRERLVATTPTRAAFSPPPDPIRRRAMSVGVDLDANIG